MKTVTGTRLGQVAFAVAAAGGLYDGVQRAEGTIGDGEIHIHTCFNELG